MTPREVSTVINSIPGANIIAAPINLLSAILGPSLANLACVPGNPDWPGCATPGGSAAAISAGLQRGPLGLSPTEADARAQVVAAAAAAGTLGGGAASRGSGPALSMR